MGSRLPRALGTTPIDFELLDLRAFAGGLTPVRQVGSMQSIGLAMKGADGRSYTFRTSDKDPKRTKPLDFGDTVPARLFQDSTTANHPGVGFVVPPLAEVAGVLHTTPRYVFMPDDPALGEFRKTFGGKPGTIEEFPQPGAGGAPGFAGATEIVSTGELWKKFLAGEAHVDDRALLRARLFDLWIQDWDRHNKQWRWLRRRQERALRADARGSRSGFLALLRLSALDSAGDAPEVHGLRRFLPELRGLDDAGRRMDRWLPSAVGRAAFEETARELAARLTDQVVDDAVGRLPPELVCARRRSPRPRRSRSAATVWCPRRSSSTRASLPRWTFMRRISPTRCG